MRNTSLLILCAVCGLLMGILLGMLPASPLKGAWPKADLSGAATAAAINELDQRNSPSDTVQRELEELRVQLRVSQLRLSRLENRLQELASIQIAQFRDFEVALGFLSKRESESRLDAPLDDGSQRGLLEVEQDVEHSSRSSVVDQAGWVVHIATVGSKMVAMDIATRAEATLNRSTQIFEREAVGWMVKVCELDTQVQAQEIVRQLRQGGIGEEAWIGRACRSAE